jgi:diguanylate cyclase (GGDEF)-like protein
VVLYIDVDRMQRLNDAEGHESGDAVLAELWSLIRAVPDALVERLGGQRFVVVLPDAGRDRGMKVAEAIRSAAERIATVSIGMAVSPGPVDTLIELVEAAAAAMYEAKVRGRNQVVCRPEPVGLELVRATVRTALEGIRDTAGVDVDLRHAWFFDGMLSWRRIHEHPDAPSLEGGRVVPVARSSLLDVARPDTWDHILGAGRTWVYFVFHRDPAGGWAVGVEYSRTLGLFPGHVGSVDTAGPLSPERIVIVDA